MARGYDRNILPNSYQVLIKVSLHDVSRMYCNTEVFIHVVEESTFLMKIMLNLVRICERAIQAV